MNERLKRLEAIERALKEHAETKPRLFFVSPCGGGLWHCTRDRAEIAGPDKKESVMAEIGKLLKDDGLTNLVFIDEMGEE